MRVKDVISQDKLSTYINNLCGQERRPFDIGDYKAKF